ncbi:MAG: MarR family winged helix-turn-helix transcriptional regulator [Gammaproteobacteria bacterium]|nr:MarR family winged helix-turn-helix transcriptional regulator [Gammaproteobacteria bacterium]
MSTTENDNEPARLAVPHRIDRHLLAGLVRAVDWFDNGLQNVLASRGFKTLHRTQSMIMVHIASGIESPADIAREMGLTRQNVHHMAKSLIADGLIEQALDTKDPRRSVYRLSDAASDIRGAALETLRELEAALGERIGFAEVQQLKRLLGRDWGPEVTNHNELETAVRVGPQSVGQG